MLHIESAAAPRKASAALRSASRSRPSAPVRDPRLTRLLAEIGVACDGPSADQGAYIIAELKAVATDPTFLTAEQRAGRADCYARHVLGEDPAGRFTVMAIVWGPGQFSPPHGHHTWCAYAVCGAALTETEYAFDDAAARAAPLRVSERVAGYACFAPAGLDHVHRLGNAGAASAVSIHVYGVGRDAIATGINNLVTLA